jgi:HlyD family secretion protein
VARRRRFVIASVIVVVLALVALSAVVRRKDSGVEVRLEEVQRRDLVATVTASGQVKPKTKVDVASDITGRIVNLEVEEGQWVNKGDLLLNIDPTQFQASVSRAEAALSSAQAASLQAQVNRDQAKRQLDRQMRLKDTDPNLVSTEQLEQAQQSFDVAEAVYRSQQHQVAQSRASLEEARDLLSKTTLRAPMTGRVTRLAVEEGEVALASTFSRETGLLLTIADLSLIQIDVRVDETDVVRLSIGDSADVTIDAFPDTTFIGRVTKISQSAIQVAAGGNNGDRAVDYDVEITLTNPPENIRPDLSGTAKVITDTRRNALSIPIIALTLREHNPISTLEEGTPDSSAAKDTEGVFVVQDGVAQFHPVRVGIAGEEHFEVLEGLVEGDSIVAGPYQTIRDLKDSTKVRPTKAEENRRVARAVSQHVAPSASTVPDTTQPIATPPGGTVALERDSPPTLPAESEVRQPGTYSVQVLASGREYKARLLAQRLQDAGYVPRIVHDTDGLFKVRVGVYTSRTDAEPTVDALAVLLSERPFMVREAPGPVLASGRNVP